MTEIRYSLEQINQTAAQIVALIDAPVLLLFGEMGAGKTTLIKAICQALGVVDEVSSPTFALVNEYQTDAGESVFHFDMYRINDEEEALDFGFEEYVESNSICLIEWPEKIQSLWPAHFGVVQIETDGAGRRVKCYSNCTFETMPNLL